MSNTMLARLPGRRYLLEVGDGLRITVTAKDARMRFTFVELLIEPEGGTGQAWVPLAALTEAKETEDAPAAAA